MDHSVSGVEKSSNLPDCSGEAPSVGEPAELSAPLPTPPNPAIKGPSPSSIPRTDHKVNVELLQFLLCDYVGGGKGKSFEAAVLFLRHYIDRYVSQYPEDLDARKIQRALSEAFYSLPGEDVPLSEVVDEIVKKISEEGYLVMGGGIQDGDGGGHALMYEFVLQEDKTVTFQLTNSGDGLQFHPRYEGDKRRKSYYRTLVFSGAKLEDLQRSQLIEYLVSFRRGRVDLCLLKDQLKSWQPKRLNIIQLYEVLLHLWPGKQAFSATNPGGAQRAESCSLQAVMKWTNQICENGQHPLLNIWVKSAAFSDYLDNTDVCSSQLIGDALRKMSTHIDKMDKRGELSDDIFAWWKEISQRAVEVKGRAIAFEVSEREKRALSTAEKGFELDLFKVVQLKPSEKVGGPAIVASYQYPHAFPGESVPFGELSKLREGFIAPPYQEMAHRLNFIRLLPDCNQEELFEGMDKKRVLTDLGGLFQLFFSDSRPTLMHLPDSFVVDLLNAWMMIYGEAKKEGAIFPEVLLEWLNGVSLLIGEYSGEYSFDSPRSQKRWLLIARMVAQEKVELQIRLGEGYSPPLDYWTIYDRDFDAGNYQWMPFGIQFKWQDPSQ